MAWLCVWMFASIFGMVVEVKQTSTRDRLERKKYMGVWRWESEMMARTMSRFPSMVTKYMDRNRQSRRGCSSGPSDSPKRRNPAESERFPDFICEWS